jgi:hypothetical protein
LVAGGTGSCRQSARVSSQTETARVIPHVFFVAERNGKGRKSGRDRTARAEHLYIVGKKLDRTRYRV